MTIKEVIADLLNEVKPYTGKTFNGNKLSRQMFSSYVRRISLNKCKPDTIAKFFSCFGYVGSFNSWQKEGFNRVTVRHISVNIEYLLREKDLTGYLNNANGVSLPDLEAREALQELLKEGARLIPSGGCENFSPQTGCKGHVRYDPINK